MGHSMYDLVNEQERKKNRQTHSHTSISELQRHTPVLALTSTILTDPYLSPNGTMYVCIYTYMQTSTCMATAAILRASLTKHRRSPTTPSVYTLSTEMQTGHKTRRQKPMKGTTLCKDTWQTSPSLCYGSRTPDTVDR